MSELSLPPAERARKAYTRVLSGLQEPGSQMAIAAALGLSQTTVSRIKNERLEECLAFLYAAGWKLVDSDRVCITPEALEFMRATTVGALSDQQRARQFFGADE